MPRDSFKEEITTKYYPKYTYDYFKRDLYDPAKNNFLVISSLE